MLEARAQTPTKWYTETNVCVCVCTHANTTLSFVLSAEHDIFTYSFMVNVLR